MKTIDRYFILIILLIIFSPWYLSAQIWPVTYGEPNEYDVNFDVAEAYDNGYFVLGNMTTDGVYTNSWLIKTDVNGEVLWEKIFTNTGYNLCTAMEPTMDGGVLLCGFIRDELGLTHPPSVIKLNTCGEKVWCRHFDEGIITTGIPWAQDIKESPEGDIIVLVNMYDENPNKTMHLFKLSADGEVLWRNAYCNGYEHPEAALPLGESVTIAPNGKYLISGSVYWEDPWNPGDPKGLRPLIVQVNNLGKEEWLVPIGINDTIFGDAFKFIDIRPDTITAIGYSLKESIDDEGLIMSVSNSGEELIVNEINAKSIDTSMTRVRFLDLIKVGDKSVIASSLGDQYWENPMAEIITDTNLFDPNLMFHSYIQYDNADIWYCLDKIDSGKYISSFSLKVNVNNWDISLSKLNLNLEFDTLDPGTYNYDSLCTKPGLPQTGFISLDDCNVWVGMDEIPTPDQYYESIRWIPITAYPNPVKNGKLSLEFQNTKHHQNMELRCYDNYGRQIHSQKIYKAQQDTDLDVTGWSKGVYVAVIYSNGGARGKVKFVVE